MKRVALAGVILLLLLAFCGFSLFWIDSLEADLNSRLIEIERAIDAEEYDRAADLTDSFCQNWDHWEAQFAAFVRHNTLEQVTASIAQLPALLHYEDYSEFMAEIQYIQVLLHHIRDSEIPYPRNLV